jgi:glycerophosphoryl diester phosphodiesterase
LKPENTLPAFETALDLGVDTLELDLHLTADDQIVIWHDAAIDPSKCTLDPAIANPTAPNPESSHTASADLMIRHLTLFQIQEYRCDRNPEPARFAEQDNEPTPLAGNAYGIVTLGQLFDFVVLYAASLQKSEAQRQHARLVRFNVETKRVPDNPATIGDDFDGERPGTLERTLVSVILDHGMAARVTVQSFDHRSLWAIRQIAPQLRLAALVTGSPSVDLLAARGSTILSPQSSLVTPSLLEQAHALGLKVIPWTVNEPEEMQRLIGMGVDGLITDRPDLILTLEKQFGR